MKPLFGTKFQLKVWKFLITIPKGSVKTYKQVAIAIKDLNQPEQLQMLVLKTLMPQKYLVIELSGLMEVWEVILEEVELLKN